LTERFNAWAKCKGCGKPIIWAKAGKGGRIPVEPLPEKEGNLRLEVRDEVVIAIHDTTPNFFGENDRYAYHGNYCPAAQEARRGRP
jgi:hypothetical protein